MKAISLLFVFFLICSFTASAQDTSLAVTANGKVGIGTSAPHNKLEINSGSEGVSTSFTTTSVFSGVTFINAYTDSGQVMIGAQAGDLRLVTSGSDRISVKDDGKVGIGTLNPISELQVNGTVTVTGNVNRLETGAASMIPVAYANVAADGTIRTDATTDNVTLDSHTPGSGNYYFTITNQDVYFTNTMCIATILGDPGIISWDSSGGGTVLYIGTRNISGAAQDMGFTFIVYKK
jgi:hypothetical protein